MDPDCLDGRLPVAYQTEHHAKFAPKTWVCPASYYSGNDGCDVSTALQTSAPCCALATHSSPRPACDLLGLQMGCAARDPDCDLAVRRDYELPESDDDATVAKEDGDGSNTSVNADDDNSLAEKFHTKAVYRWAHAAGSFTTEADQAREMYLQTHSYKALAQGARVAPPSIAQLFVACTRRGGRGLHGGGKLRLEMYLALRTESNNAPVYGITQSSQPAASGKKNDQVMRRDYAGFGFSLLHLTSVLGVGGVGGGC
jgi:hypothetical protein